MVLRLRFLELLARCDGAAAPTDLPGARTLLVEVLCEKMQRLVQFGGRKGMPLSVGSVLACLVLRFLPPASVELKSVNLSHVLLPMARTAGESFDVVSNCQSDGDGADVERVYYASFGAFSMFMSWLEVDRLGLRQRSRSIFEPNAFDFSFDARLICALPRTSRQARAEIAVVGKYAIHIFDVMSNAKVCHWLLNSEPFTAPRFRILEAAASVRHIAVLLFGEGRRSQPRIALISRASGTTCARFDSVSDADTPMIVEEMPVFSSLCFLPDGEHLAVADWFHGCVLVFDLIGTLVRTIEVTARQTDGSAVSPCCEKFDGMFTLDAEETERLVSAAMDAFCVMTRYSGSIACTRDELLVMSASDRAIFVFDLLSNAHVATLRLGNAETCEKLARIAVGGLGNVYGLTTTAQVWCGVWRGDKTKYVPMTKP